MTAGRARCHWDWADGLEWGGGESGQAGGNGKRRGDSDVGDVQDRSRGGNQQPEYLKGGRQEVSWVDQGWKGGSGDIGKWRVGDSWMTETDRVGETSRQEVGGGLES